MTVRTILKMGDPILLQKSAPIDTFNSPGLDSLIEDLLDTMAAADGAGLAAPQIGVLQQVVIFGIAENPRYPDADRVPLTLLINPVIEILSEDTATSWEGCLSIPGMSGRVTRASHIRYAGFDPMGNALEREVKGFHAIVVQHECDHLEGILYPMRMQDMSQFGFNDTLQSSNT